MKKTRVIFVINVILLVFLISCGDKSKNVTNNNSIDLKPITSEVIADKTKPQVNTNPSPTITNESEFQKLLPNEYEWTIFTLKPIAFSNNSYTIVCAYTERKEKSMLGKTFIFNKDKEMIWSSDDFVATSVLRIDPNIIVSGEKALVAVVNNWGGPVGMMYKVDIYTFDTNGIVKKIKKFDLGMGAYINQSSDYIDLYGPDSEIVQVRLVNGEYSETIKRSREDKKDIVNQDKNVMLQYKKYYNDRYGFSIEYPSTFNMQQAPTNNDGRRFLSQDNSSELLVYGSNNIIGETVETGYNNVLDAHKYASFKVKGDNWFVVSWIEEDKIVYEKRVIGKGSTNTFIVKYPIKQKDEYDAIINYLNSSFSTPSLDIAH